MDLGGYGFDLDAFDGYSEKESYDEVGGARGLVKAPAAAAVLVGSPTHPMPCLQELAVAAPEELAMALARFLQRKLPASSAADGCMQLGE